MHYLNSIFVSEDIFSIISVVLGGLALFLYGITLMSDSLKRIAGSKLKTLIAKATETIYKGILTGTIVTCLIQSSSATTVIVIGLVSARLMTFKQAIGVMMGANIGTTVTAFLIGLNISKYSFLIMAVGAVILLFFEKKRVHEFGRAIFGFAALFVGLELMGLALEPLSAKPWFEGTMTSMSRYPVLGVLVGTTLTSLIQSSSASIGVLQQIFGSGAISLKAALPVLLGCNIGTTITALLSSLSGTREAKQAAIFHLFFNLFGTLIFLIFLNPYTSLFTWVEREFLGASNKLTIAFAHIFFNTITTILMLFVYKYIMVLIQKILPLKNDIFTEVVDQLDEDLLISSPKLALEGAKSRIIETGEFSLQMAHLVKNYFNSGDEKYFDECLDLEEKVNYYNHKIHDYLLMLKAEHLTDKEVLMQAVLMDILSDLERIANHSVNIVEFLKSRNEMNAQGTPCFCDKLNHFLDLSIEQITNALNCFKTGNKDIAKKVVLVEEEINKLERKFRLKQLATISSGNINDVFFVDILSNLERISDHSDNIARNIIDPHYMSQEITKAKAYL